jgi:CheY-like chemotaxis protein
MTSHQRRVIIVADDDEGERFLIQKAMEDGGVESELLFVEDGDVLIERLTTQLALARSGVATMPCLILLDLNMPRMDGREVLRTLKSQPDFRWIPIVVLTNSRNPQDVASTYRDGANSFFTKPLTYSDLVDLVRLLKTYWLEAALLPQGAA